MRTTVGGAIPAGSRLRAVTSAERESALADFDRALGKYPAAADHHDEQRAIERRNAAQQHELHKQSQRTTGSAKSIQL